MADALSDAPTAGVDSFWDVYSRVYDSVYQLMPYRKLLWDTYQALELGPGMRVLDAGCGTGNFEHFVHQKNPPSVRIDAVDFSAAMLAVAKKKNSDLDNVEFSRGDLSARLPYPDSCFDRILSINVLYALPDPDSTMRELLRVLKPGGVIVVTSPAPEFAVAALVVDHFRRVKNIWGAWRKIATVATSVGVFAVSGVAQWALNNFVINRRETDGAYHSLDSDELAQLLRRCIPSGVGEFAVGRALADQNIFATAVKTMAA
jgi:ubiquinone/menaquinone biosynthesis C-methylase UbiE